MEYHDKSKSGAISEADEDNEDALRQERVEQTIVGKPPGFSAPGQRPRDFDRFQTSVRNHIREL